MKRPNLFSLGVSGATILANQKLSPQASLMTFFPTIIYVSLTSMEFLLALCCVLLLQEDSRPEITRLVFSSSIGASVHDPTALTGNCLLMVQFITSLPNGPCVETELMVQLMAARRAVHHCNTDTKIIIMYTYSPKL